MVVVESSMAGGRKEVALAAIALLSAVLQAHGSITAIVTPSMWGRAVRAVGVGVEAATSPACMVPLSVSGGALPLLLLVVVLGGAAYVGWWHPAQPPPWPAGWAAGPAGAAGAGGAAVLLAALAL